jgi:hypothetical protein
LFHLAEQVARDEDRPALAREGPQEFAHPADAFGVEPVGRLVKDQHARVADHRGGDAESLPHTERVPAKPPSGRRVEPHHVEHLVRALVGIAASGAHDAQVVSAGTALVRARCLEHRADGVERALQVGVSGAAHGGRATRRCDEVQHHAQRGGLAGAVGSEEAGHPAGGNREGQVVDRSDLGIDLGQVGRDQLAVHGAPSGGVTAQGD